MKRLNSIDIAKGVSIVLVAVFHMTRSYASSHMLYYNPFIRFCDTAAYGMHVHAFFIISMFFYAKGSDSNFPIQRILSLYYPYLLWSYISALILVVTPGNTEISAADLVAIPVWPILHYWFILSLIITYVIFWFARTTALLIGVAVLSLAADAIGVSQGFSPNLTSTFYFIPFAALGIYLSRYSLPQLRPWHAVVGVGLWLLGAALAVPGSMKLPTFVLSSLGAVAALWWMSENVAETLVGQLLAYVGRSSLPIYLTHVIFGSGTKIILAKLAPDLPVSASLTLSIATAVCAPLVLELIATRIRCEKLLGLRPYRFKRHDLA